MKFPVFDLHCDTALALLGTKDRTPSQLLENKLHIDLKRAGQLDGYCQCFACFTTPYMQKWYNTDPVNVFEKELEAICRHVEANRDLIGIAYSAQEVRSNYEKGKMSAVLTIEGPAGFHYDPELLEDLYGIGFRITSLGWNEQNELTGSHVTGGGLTDKGKAFVRRAQELGFLIDVSHISDEAFWQLMDITQGPVVATHSNSRHVCGHSRNLTDDMFRAICATGGVAGFNQCADFVGSAPDLDTACDHFLHFLQLDPTGKHIALGGDLDGCDRLPAGFDGVQDYPKLARRLMERGLDANTVQDIYWNNALGVMERAVPVNQK